MPRSYKITFIILFIPIFVLISAFTINYADTTNKPEAVNGTLDLTDWDWEQNGTIDLNGQWEFYWQELLTPEDFKAANVSKKKDFITLPGAWNKYKFNEEELSGDGYATYRLLINHPNDEILGIKIPRIFTSYNLWINSELIASAGKVGMDKNQMTPQYLPKIRYIKPGTDTIELVIQVTNFRHRSGGILESIQIGSASQISEIA
jgi:hypothetical protein